MHDNVSAMMLPKHLQKCIYGSATHTVLHFTTTIVHDMGQIILEDATTSAGVWTSGYLANTHCNMRIISSTYCIIYETAFETAAQDSKRPVLNHNHDYYYVIVEEN